MTICTIAAIGMLTLFRYLSAIAVVLLVERSCDEDTHNRCDWDADVVLQLECNRHRASSAIAIVLLVERSFDEDMHNSCDWDADVVLLLECNRHRASLKQVTIYSFQSEVSSTPITTES
jgi:hypothetical protein